MASLWGIVRRRLTWANLSAFGNSPVVRLVAFAPIVATLLKLRQDFSVLDRYLAEAEWLYWSLMLIAGGQLLYFFLAPREIKKYGSDIERFTIENLSSLPDFRLQALRQDWIRSLYNRGSLKLERAPDTPELLNLMRDRLRDPMAMNEQVLLEYLRAYRDYWEMVQAAGQLNPVDFDAKRVWSLLLYWPALIHGEKSSDRRDRSTLMRIIGDHADGNADWRTNTLNWRYHYLNTSRRPLIAIIGLLYFAGSLYFLWRIADGLVFMAGLLVVG